MTTLAASGRFWSKVEGSSFEDCWNWLGTMKGDTGYGHIGVTGRGLVRAHRFAYEDMVGPIPSGLVLDHLCCNKRCVNPWHLEPVTIAVNTRRGDIRRRQCRQCHAERQRARRNAA